MKRGEGDRSVSSCFTERTDPVFLCGVNGRFRVSQTCTLKDRGTEEDCLEGFLGFHEPSLLVLFTTGLVCDRFRLLSKFVLLLLGAAVGFCVEVADVVTRCRGRLMCLFIGTSGGGEGKSSFSIGRGLELATLLVDREACIAVTLTRVTGTS